MHALKEVKAALPCSSKMEMFSEEKPPSMLTLWNFTALVKLNETCMGVIDFTWLTQTETKPKNMNYCLHMSVFAS